jgi:hypothetical protein
LIRWNVSPNQIYYLDCCRSKISPTKIIDVQKERIACHAQGLVDGQNNITETGLIILNEFETFLVKTKKQVAAEVLGPNAMDKIKEYRELFPAKRLPSGELARQSPQELKEKFIWFFKTYPGISWDEILDAAEYYNAVYKKKGYMYMATSSYFIKKQKEDKTISSKLADYCLEIAENPRLLDTI